MTTTSCPFRENCPFNHFPLPILRYTLHYTTNTRIAMQLQIETKNPNKVNDSLVALAHCMFHHPIPPPLPPHLRPSVGGSSVRFHLTFNHFPPSRPDHPGVPDSPGSPLLHPPGCWYESLKVFRVGLYSLLTCWKLKARTRQRCQVLFIRSW